MFVICRKLILLVLLLKTLAPHHDAKVSVSCSRNRLKLKTLQLFFEMIDNNNQ